MSSLNQPSGYLKFAYPAYSVGTPRVVPQHSKEQKLIKSIHCYEEYETELSTALIPKRSSLPGVEGAPFAPARLTARGSPT